MDRIDSISCVIIDADGTLFNLKRSIGTVCSEVLTLYGVGSDAKTLDQYVPAVWADFRERYLAQATNYRTDPARERDLWFAFIQELLRRSGFDASTQQVVEAIYDRFARGSERVLADGAVDFLGRVRGLGMRVFVATNNDDRTRLALSELGLSSYLDEVFIAGELTWKKPSEEFFREIQRRLKVPLHNLLHVGNDYELDVLAAQRAGWAAVLFDPLHQYPGNAHRVASFSELSDLLL
jgi:putative hydrolase of the HAD superfamily